jgi:hypothetical protein
MSAPAIVGSSTPSETISTLEVRHQELTAVKAKVVAFMQSLEANPDGFIAHRATLSHPAARLKAQVNSLVQHLFEIQGVLASVDLTPITRGSSMEMTCEGCRSLLKGAKVLSRPPSASIEGRTSSVYCTICKSMIPVEVDLSSRKVDQQ